MNISEHAHLHNTQHVHSTICRIFSLYTLWPLASTKVRRKFLKRLNISRLGASNDTQSRTEWPFVSSRLSMLSICYTSGHTRWLRLRFEQSTHTDTQITDPKHWKSASGHILPSSITGLLKKKVLLPLYQHQY